MSVLRYGTPQVRIAVALPKLNTAPTLVYWNVSCLPVNVASIDCGEVSIWQIPEAAHRSKHGCDSLVAQIITGPEKSIP